LTRLRLPVILYGWRVRDQCAATSLCPSTSSPVALHCGIAGERVFQADRFLTGGHDRAHNLS
jgi:hypothetical protein